MLTAALAGCGAEAQSSPSPTPPAASAVPPVSPPAASSAVSSPFIVPTAASSPSASNQAAITPSPPASQVAAPSRVTFTLAGSGNEAVINATELLAGKPAKTPASERTTAVSGAIVLDSAGQPLPGSQLAIEAAKLASDNRVRDGFVQRVTLNSASFPKITFVPKQVQGLSWPPPSSGAGSFSLMGDTTIKDQTRPQTFDVQVQFDTSGVKGKATTSLKFSDYGIAPPKAGPVIEVDQNLTVEISFDAQRT
ncbi:MAG: YceI family protein [Chloroflexi bacterium]|nr:YceI family protein [Chloroflexota bacterium]